jgi:hypothetical protein
MLLALTLAGPAYALEEVEFRQEDEIKTVAGQVLIEARDGSLLLKSPDGGLHLLQGTSILDRSSNDQPFEMLTEEALTAQILGELPEDFQVHQSKNYLIFYNTTRTYAKWCSSLLERLHKAFLGFWEKRGADVQAPEHPLVVLIFGDQASYARYAREDLGPAVSSVIGYYSIASNRVMMYDLTGMQSLRREQTNRGSMHDITALLSLPAAEPLVATIVHEATHQVAFNCGLQTRYADNPIWMSEGMAVFFETPDLRSSRSWRGIGKVNYPRWDRFRDNEARGKVAPLARLISDDQLLREPKTAVDGYAQAWAWNYYLITWHPEEYVAYLKAIAAKPILQQDTPQQRLAEFRQHFGDDLEALEADFYRRMARIR